jgi:MtN3 and saliva related transmembrane protein
VTDVLGVLAGGFGVVMGASPLLQALRTHRRRSGSDVSLTFLIVLCFGGALWLAYGVALGNAALIVANLVGVIASGSTIAVTLRWRQIEARERAGAAKG